MRPHPPADALYPHGPDTLINLVIPRSAHCAKHGAGDFKFGHTVKALRSRPGVSTYRCARCAAELRFDEDYNVWVSKRVIEELPW